MSAQRLQQDERLLELLAAEAAGSLDDDERRELDDLLATDEIPDREEFVRVAALVQTSFLDKDRHAQRCMPAHLQQKLLEQAHDFFFEKQAGNDAVTVADFEAARARSSRKQAARKSWLNSNSAGWLLAAGLALAFVVFRVDLPREGITNGLPVAQQLDTVLADPDTEVWPWKTPTEPGFENVTGDVVWNNESQTGFLRLAGMPVNDATQMQYQLWIIDPDRDTQPVDGGVFDIPTGNGEVIVPIDPKLNIISPKAFAITAEQPGGVVVSNGPLLIVASLGGRPRPSNI
ncbi:MAG: anti-sigma factor [Gammaproteobacteria bacterium]|nr:anti-sigma factor [Gammaproteobacteria bacterium]